MCMVRTRALFALTLASAIATPSEAQWTVTVLHPTGALFSESLAASESVQVGYVRSSGIVLQRASLWTGTAGSWVDLNPVGSEDSVAYSVSGSEQVGYSRIDGRQRASLWTGTATSWVDLNPPGASGSESFANCGPQQAGYAHVNGVTRASLWSGSPSSWVDLHPAGAVASWVYAVGPTRQGGRAVIDGVSRASLWNGSPQSWIDLSPTGSVGSAVHGMTPTQQVGYATFSGGVDRASLWNGSAASWEDLHPATAASSVAWAASGSSQVGFAVIDGQRHACIWSGDSASWVDIHPFLGTGFSSSEARGVSSDGVVLNVSGWAHHVPTNRRLAVLWTRPLPCSEPQLLSPISGAVVCAEESVVLTAAATGTHLEYQWRLNQAVVPAATSSTFTIFSVSLADAGSYDCVITNACGSVTSNPAVLTVRTPQILTPPVSQTVNVDQPVLFAMETDPGSPCFAGLTYQWQRRNPLVEDDAAPNAWLDLSDGGGLAGTHSPILAIFRPTPGLATGYRCRIENACGCEADANGVIYTDTVNFSAACPSDFNNDGSVDGDDVIGFFERWDAGC